MGLAFLRCSPQSKCAAHNCDPLRPLGPVLFSHGWWAKGTLPKANSSSSANIHLGGGPGQTGEQKWEENPFQTLIGPPTQKATCQATKCQGPANPSWQGTHQANTVLSQTSHHKKKLYSVSMARFSPLSEMLYCCICVLPGSGESYMPLKPVKKKSQHNIKCIVFWPWVSRGPLIYLPELRENVSGSFLMKTSGRQKETLIFLDLFFSDFDFSQEACITL